MLWLSRVLLVAGVVGLGGCGATPTQLRARASVDLDCAPEQLRLDAIDGATQKVTGCGKRAIYVQLFNNSRYPTWLLNSTVVPVTRTAAR
jgi:hypothetical protein